MFIKPVSSSVLFVFVPEDQTKLTLVIQTLSRALRHAAEAEADSPPGIMEMNAGNENKAGLRSVAEDELLHHSHR